MAKLSYKERAKIRREHEILRTAARMIRDKGYMNLNMDELAEEVGISKPTLYQHFKGKDDMVARAMLHTMREMETFVQSINGHTAIEKLENVMRYMLEAHNDPEGLSMAILQDHAVTLQHLTIDKAEIRHIRERVIQTVYSFIDEARANGDIRLDMSNLVVIGVMFASLSVLRSPEILEDFSIPPEEIIETVLGFFRRGISP